MSAKSASIEVLRQAGKALSSREITKRIIKQGLGKTEGKTPNNTVRRDLNEDIRKKGSRSDFVKIGSKFLLRDFTVPSSDTKMIFPEADKSSSRTSEFSFKDCAEKVLEEFGNKKPMHYKKITEKALKKGWLLTKARYPADAMHVQMSTEIKRQQKRGEQPRFVRHGRGYFGLSQWMARGLAFQIEQHNKQVRNSLLERLLVMKPGEFEILISRLLTEMGFDNVQVTRLSRDGGIDVLGTLVVGNAVRIKMAVQVKRWNKKNKIQAQMVQSVRGSLGAHDKGLIITTSDFTPRAINEARQADKTPIDLMNGKKLVALLIEHGIGVCTSSADLLEIDEESLLLKENE